ncbi:hypothetical protein [Alloactinosynnema sp. L-07]|nr:hypothetical protein [Alloactinosynnema sp. L-07]
MVDYEPLRTACRSFIAEALDALQDEHVVPTPRFRPYIKVGSDYFGDTVRAVSHYRPLEEALEACFPDRFQHRANPFHIEHATAYIFSLLEAVVARCATDGATAVEESIDELIDVLSSASYEVVSARHVAHLTTTTGNEAQIGEITVVPEPKGFGGLTRRIQREISGAARAWPTGDPRPYNPPHALLITRETSTDPAPYQVVERLSDRFDRFLLIARLLTAGTARTVYEVSGMTTLVSRIDPFMNIVARGQRRSLFRRTVRLTGNESDAFTAIGELIDRADVKRDGMVATSFDVALARFSQSYIDDNPYEPLVDLATALEAVMIGTEKDNEGLTLRLRMRVATLLATSDDAAEDLFGDVSRLYGLRSRLVHGGQIKDKDLRKEVGRISTVPTEDATDQLGVALHRAVDRMRDLVRRAILARLCLAAEGGPWPFTGETPVDAILSDDTKRVTWRTWWHNHLENLGVGYAADRAAVDFADR